MLIKEKYMVFSQIGKGAFGNVFKGIDIETQEYVAIKFESQNVSKERLDKESQLYTFLKEKNKRTFIPNIYWYGSVHNYNVLIMTRLGPSFENLIRKYNYTIQLKSILLLTINFFKVLKEIHSLDIIHQDIKPDNFAIGRNKLKKNIYIFDFGLSKIKESDMNEKTNSLLGTVRYASIRAHEGYSLSYRDDFESLMYMIVYLYNRKLPWQGIQGKSKSEKNIKVLEMKKKIDLSQLCYRLPIEYQKIIHYSRNLEFNEKPKYDTLINIIEERLNGFGFDINDQYEWTKLRTNSEKNYRKYLLKKTIKMINF